MLDPKPVRQRGIGARLAVGVSFAGVSVLGLALEAQAETTVSTARTTSIATSTANNGAADDVTITSDGSVKPGSGAAVTLDSNNTLSNAGSIVIQDSDGATGISVVGGHTGTLSNTGTIQIDETTEVTDSDGDGDLDGPFVKGSSRYGVRLGPGAAFTGTITNSGSITVEGDDSAGISIEAPLLGSLNNTGSVTITGARSTGLKIAAPVSGDVNVTGLVSATGEAASAINLTGDLGGALKIQSGVTATGYRSTTTPSTTAALNALDADDLLQGGPAVAIKANIAGGILVDVPPTDTDTENTDEDGDGVEDSVEGTGAVYSYGAAPAMVIGAVGRDVSIGDFGTGDLAYGLVIKGTVTGLGVYDGIPATGLQLGVAGGGAVTTGGGVLVLGTVSASATEADATGLLVKNAASAPVIRVDGTLTSVVTAEKVFTSRGLVIEAGGQTTSFLNAVVTSANLFGEAGDAVAITDRSGSLTDIQNVRTIAANITATDDADDTDDTDTDASNEKISGRAIAMDLTANTSGVSIVQNGVNDGDDLADGVADTDTDGDGVDDTDESSITGAILLGSGADRVQILNGSVTGDIAFGSGANSLLIDGTGSVKGALTTTGGSLDLSIGKGSLEVSNTGTLNLSGLALGSGSSLVLTADPATGAATLLDVKGQATISDGAKIGMRLTSLLKTSATYQIIRADSLSAGALDSSLLGELPYLYDASVQTNAAAGVVSISLSRKTAAGLSLPSDIAPAYEPFITAIDKDADVRDAVLAQTDREGLLSIYQQMLPARTNGAFEMLALGSRAFARPLEDRTGNESGGAWVQEVNFGLINRTNSYDGRYKGWGLGFSGGYETAATNVGQFGVTLGASSSTIDSNLVANTVEGGLAWRLTWGRLELTARTAAGYVFLKNDRTVSAYDEAGTSRILLREAKSDWDGRTVSAALSALYDQPVGKAFYLRPRASVEYFSLKEGAYKEAGGGDAIDLAVSSRTSSSTSSLFGLALGANFGDTVSSWGPELQVGWRSVTNQNVDPTTAHFVSGTESFVLPSEMLAGDGWSARMGIKGGNGYGAYAVEGGAEQRGDLTTLDVRLSAHFNF